MPLQVSSQAIYNERLAILLGVITLACALATFASCRSCVSLFNHIGLKNLTQIKGYQSFYKYHTYYWWVFGVVLLSHIMMATVHSGLPQAGDPDAGIHWVILLVGMGGALSALALFSSCRVSPRLLAPTAPKISLANKTYRTFFNLHSYYWWILAAFIAGHFTVSFLHAGIWPGTG